MQDINKSGRNELQGRSSFEKQAANNEFIDFMVDGNVAGLREAVGDRLKGDFESQSVDLVGAEIL